MRMIKEMTLAEAIPEREIIRYMPNLSFIPDETVAMWLDAEYFNNHSGNKQISPIVERWLEYPPYSDPEYEYSLNTELAMLIANRYRYKWEQLFKQYSSLETLDLLKNISLVDQTTHGKTVTNSSTDTLQKTGTETETTMLDEMRTESYDSENPRKTSRSITGSFTDSTNETSTRSGTEEVVESFPTERKSTKKTTGGYSDEDTITNTRSGSQKVTDKGGTETSVYGFNSSVPVPSQIVAPEDSALGTTSETTFGVEGLKDAHSGTITRTYNPITGLVEETSESGQRKTATTYGQDGLQDSLTSGKTRTYNNYHDDITESGEKSLNITYGADGKTIETSFDNRRDVHSISGTVANSGTDKQTQEGYNYKSLIDEYFALFTGAEYINFMEIVYSDMDEILTCPYYV